jgi:hypothetical protein
VFRSEKTIPALVVALGELTQPDYDPRHQETREKLIKFQQGQG